MKVQKFRVHASACLSSENDIFAVNPPRLIEGDQPEGWTLNFKFFSMEIKEVK
ncbi:MAG: hypothetical protein P9X24_04115 [Candidatus Hatepunaea meridiana]|nr:hypothetical protein [Candidatus Hatepunaea meridiana]